MLRAGQDPSDRSDLSEFQPGATLLLTGKWFGATPPKAWLECRDASGTIKCLRLKVLKPYAFANAEARPAASVMDPYTGESRMLVQLPDELPAGATALVLDNGVGLAAMPVAGP